MDIFFGKINDYYKDNNNTNNPIYLLNDINKSLFLLKKMQNKEDDIYKRDSNFLSHGFVCNNDKLNGITVDNVIMQTEFTIIFSFNYTPEKNFYELKNSKTYMKSNSLKSNCPSVSSSNLSKNPINKNPLLNFDILNLAI